MSFLGYGESQDSAELREQVRGVNINFSFLGLVAVKLLFQCSCWGSREFMLVVDFDCSECQQGDNIACFCHCFATCLSTDV